jgi:hypothetical protein
MSPVFLSYKRVDDAARAKVVRARLEALGLDIFQDVDMSAGEFFPTILNKRIRAATAVLVLWSKSSIDSHWVVSEAQKGLEQAKLVAVAFDRDITREMPMPFNGIQTPDLSDWIETGSKADHDGWRSVLKALGGLCNRPLAEIANILESGTPETKADFVRNHPNDPFAVGLAAELKAAKLYEFEQQANRLKHLAEKQLAEEVRRMNRLRSQLVGMMDAALAGGTYPQLDVKHEIHKVLNPYDANLPEAALGKRGRRALVEEIARMRSEIGDLRNAAAVAESAKAESDGQITDLERQVRQGSRPATWLMAAAVILGIGVVWLANDRFDRKDLIPATVADAERQKIQDQLDSATKQLNTANVANRRVSEEASETTRKLDAAEKMVAALTKKRLELDPLAQQLEMANSKVVSLTREKDDLLGKIAETTEKLGKTSAASDALAKKHEAVSASIETLTKEKDGISGKLNETTANLVKTTAALDSLTKKYETASGSVDTLTKQLTAAAAKLEIANKTASDKQKLADQSSEAYSKLEAKIASISQQQVTDTARAASESRCDEFMAYDTDPDLPANAKRPADQAKLGGITPQEAIDTCFAALSAQPKSASRRILLQLARSYIRLGNGARGTDQPLATSSYSTAVMLARQAALLGSAQADVMLGYIFGGNLNTPRFTFIDTPNYPYALARLEASAAAKHPFGLLYAGSYLTWPECSHNTLPSTPEQGMKYIREAQEKNVAAAYYAEGYYFYFAPPGVKNTDWALKMFDKASKMNFKEADAFLGSTPPKSGLCPTKIF